MGLSPGLACLTLVSVRGMQGSDSGKLGAIPPFPSPDTPKRYRLAIAAFGTSKTKMPRKHWVCEAFGSPYRSAKNESLAEWTGLEPATPGVTGRYSNQLNYHSW